MFTKALLQLLLCLQIGIQGYGHPQQTQLVGGQGFVPQKVNIIRLDWIGTPFDAITSYIIQDTLSSDRFGVGAFFDLEVDYMVKLGQGKAAAALLAKDPRLAGFLRYDKPYNQVKGAPESGIDGRVLPQRFGTGFKPMGGLGFDAVKAAIERFSSIQNKPLEVERLWQRSRYYRDFEGHVGRGVDYIAFGLDADGHDLGTWFQDVDGKGHYLQIESFYCLPSALTK